ncbi:hypothetical protein [Buttiauxella sp.]|uniref:hypothetical protein n=1 Tax=Buttiauxella sp. TaxID=1972222 RepID=UPI003C71DAB3
MRLTNNKSWLLTGLLLIASTIATVKGYLYWKNTHFSCTGELTLQREDNIANVTMQYVFNGDTGAVLLRGEVISNNAPVEQVSQNIFFDFQRKGNDYFLISKSVTDSTGNPTDLPLLKRTFPLFYLEPDAKFFLNIKQLTGSSWLFTTSRSPSLFCSK